jgi:hypothetical protein
MMNHILIRIAQIAEELESQNLNAESEALDEAMWNLSDQQAVPAPEAPQGSISTVEKPIHDLVDSIVQRMIVEGVTPEEIADSSGQERVKREMELALNSASSIAR